MFKTVSKAVAAGALAAGLFTTIMVPVTAHASTSTADITRRHVCAQDVYVRDQPGGVSIGLLLNGETFDVEGVSGAYFYGMAYGHVNKHGWVLGTALC
jgi:hypothetical protein